MKKRNAYQTELIEHLYDPREAEAYLNAALERADPELAGNGRARTAPPLYQLNRLTFELWRELFACTIRTPPCGILSPFKGVCQIRGQLNLTPILILANCGKLSGTVQSPVDLVDQFGR